MGANVGSIVNVMGQGAAQRTDYGSDLMIDGDGFFIVKDATGFSFTRAGVFEVDAKGNLVDPNGFNVCGWKAIDDPDNPGKQKVVKDNVTPINIYEGNNSYSPAKATTSIEFTGNFNQTTNSTQKNTISFYDSQGNKYVINVQFEKDPNAPNEWNLTIPQDAAQAGHVEVTVNGSEKMYLPIGNLNLNPATPKLKFNADGTLEYAGAAGSKSISIDNIDLTQLKKNGKWTIITC